MLHLPFLPQVLNTRVPLTTSCKHTPSRMLQSESQTLKHIWCHIFLLETFLRGHWWRCRGCPGGEHRSTGTGTPDQSGHYGEWEASSLVWAPGKKSERFGSGSHCPARARMSQWALEPWSAIALGSPHPIATEPTALLALTKQRHKYLEKQLQQVAVWI